MPAWLGILLTGVFVVLTGYRLGHRDAPAALMAAGMAVMAAGMGGVGPHLVHGTWWALGFALIALWPVLERVRTTRGWRGGSGRRENDPRGSVAPWHPGHLVGGAAMVYMCVAGLGHPSAEPGAGGATAYRLTAGQLTAGQLTAGQLTAGQLTAGQLTAGQLTAGHDHSGHAHGGHAAADAALGVDAGSLPAGLFALGGWLLACYFLLATITALTRRGADGGVPLSGRAVTEATMTAGTMIMLLAMA